MQLNELSFSTIVLNEPEPQLLFDGRLVLESTPKKAKRCIGDIMTYIEAFAFYSLVLTSHLPLRWKDVSQ